jgi:nucleoside-diphosphate-sugar epimerase
MNKVLVVGGAGYVGSVLVEELLELGYAVKVLDRLYYGSRGLDLDRVELVVGDMRNVGPEILDGVSAVINLGGLSNDPTAEYNPEANFSMNVTAAEKLAMMCRDTGTHRYILASSCSIYDLGTGDETRDIVQDESARVAPQAAYSSSKLAAETAIFSLDGICAVALRKGTVFGFSRRMRYDLVVNTFVKDALTKGYITIHCGGEMWRPLVDVRDAARAYIAVLRASDPAVGGKGFNVASFNMRVSELALRVRAALLDIGIGVDILPDYSYKGVRDYRVSSQRIEELGFRPQVNIEESVSNMVEKIKHYGYTDFDSPRYYNIRWMQTLEEASKVLAVTGSVFE